MSERCSAVNLRKVRALILDQSILTFLPDGITVCGVRSQADDGGAQPRALTIGILISLHAMSLTLRPFLTPNRSAQKHAYITKHSLQSHCRSLEWPKIHRLNQDTKSRNTGVHSYILKTCIHKTTVWLHNSVHLQQSPRSTEKQTASHGYIGQRKDVCYCYNKMWLNRTDVYLLL